MGFYGESSFGEKMAEKWVAYKDYNPDRQRSTAGMWVEPDHQGNYRWVLAVKGLGALVMRATSNDTTGRLNFQGLSEFTENEIGHRK